MSGELGAGGPRGREREKRGAGGGGRTREEAGAQRTGSRDQPVRVEERVVVHCKVLKKVTEAMTTAILVCLPHDLEFYRAIAREAFACALPASFCAPREFSLALAPARCSFR